MGAIQHGLRQGPLLARQLRICPAGRLAAHRCAFTETQEDRIGSLALLDCAGDGVAIVTVDGNSGGMAQFDIGQPATQSRQNTDLRLRLAGSPPGSAHFLCGIRKWSDDRQAPQRFLQRQRSVLVFQQHDGPACDLARQFQTRGQRCC